MARMKELINKVHRDDIAFVSCCPHIDLIAVGSKQGNVVLYRLPFQRIMQVDLKMEPTCCCWAPRGRVVCVATADGHVLLLEVAEGAIAWRHPPGGVDGAAARVLAVDWQAAEPPPPPASAPTDGPMPGERLLKQRHLHSLESVLPPLLVVEPASSTDPTNAETHEQRRHRLVDEAMGRLTQGQRDYVASVDASATLTIFLFGLLPLLRKPLLTSLSTPVSAANILTAPGMDALSVTLHQEGKVLLQCTELPVGRELSGYIADLAAHALYVAEAADRSRQAAAAAQELAVAACDNAASCTKHLTQLGQHRVYEVLERCLTQGPVHPDDQSWLRRAEVQPSALQRARQQSTQELNDALLLIEDCVNVAADHAAVCSEAFCRVAASATPETGMCEDVPLLPLVCGPGDTAESARARPLASGPRLLLAAGEVAAQAGEVRSAAADCGTAARQQRHHTATFLAWITSLNRLLPARAGQQRQDEKEQQSVEEARYCSSLLFELVCGGDPCGDPLLWSSEHPVRELFAQLVQACGALCAAAQELGGAVTQSFTARVRAASQDLPGPSSATIHAAEGLRSAMAAGDRWLYTLAADPAGETLALCVVTPGGPTGARWQLQGARLLVASPGRTATAVALVGTRGEDQVDTKAARLLVLTHGHGAWELTAYSLFDCDGDSRVSLQELQGEVSIGALEPQYAPLALPSLQLASARIEAAPQAVLSACVRNFACMASPATTRGGAELPGWVAAVDLDDEPEDDEGGEGLPEAAMATD